MDKELNDQLEDVLASLMIDSDSGSSSRERSSHPGNNNAVLELLDSNTPHSSRRGPPTSVSGLFSDRANTYMSVARSLAPSGISHPEGRLFNIPTLSGRTPEQRLDWIEAWLDTALTAAETHTPRLRDMELPAAVHPSYFSRSSLAGTNGPMYRILESTKASVRNLVGAARESFRVLDSVQESIRTLSDPAPALPSSSTAVQLPTLPTIPSFHDLLSDQHSQEALPSPQFAEKYADPQGTTGGTTYSMYKQMVEENLGNEAILRQAIMHLRQFLRSFSETDDSADYLFAQTLTGFMILHLYEIKWEDKLLDLGNTMITLAFSKLKGSQWESKSSSYQLYGHWAYGQRLLAQRHGEESRLTLAIELLQSTCSKAGVIPLNIKRPLCIELAACLYSRYQAQGNPDDLDAAIEQLHSLHERDDMPTRLSCFLGNAHLQRFAQRGNLDDLDRSIYLAQPAHGPSGSQAGSDVTRAEILHLLSMALSQRFNLLLDISDLDQAISHGRTAIELLNEDHPLVSSYKSDLAILLLSRFESEDEPSDLTAAFDEIAVAITVERAVSMTPIPLKAVFGTILAIRGRRDGDIEEVEEAIRGLTLVRKEFSGPLHFESYIEQYLSKALIHRFHLSRTREDLEMAVYHASLACQKAHENGPHWAQLSLELGQLLMVCYGQTQDSTYCRDAITRFRWVARSSVWPSVRLRASIDWADAAEGFDLAGHLEALELGLSVLPSVAWTGHRMSVRYRMLSSQSSNIASRAAACAIKDGELRKAIDYLEIGRNVLWSQALQFQQAAIPEEQGRGGQNESGFLARFLSQRAHDDSYNLTIEQAAEMIQKGPPEFVELTQALEKSFEAIRQRMIDLSGGNEDRVDADLQGYKKFKEMMMDVYEEASLHSAAARWSTLQPSLEQLGEVSPNPSCAPLDVDLHAVLQMGIIVVLNASGLRCDAMILTAATSSDTVALQHVLLPELSGDQVHAWAETLRLGLFEMERNTIGLSEYEDSVLIPILRGLWTYLALPLLEYIDTQPVAPTRVWWYPTGPFAFLPIHAASPCVEGEPGLAELVVSSYTPTLRSLIRASKAPSMPFRLLAVGQPVTPGYDLLPAVEKEMKSIRKLCQNTPDKLTSLIGEEGTIHRVTKALPDHTWVHFSCHANQDEVYPFHSAFFLYDGPFRLSKLMQLDLTHVQFAYLSACLTSAGDVSLPDECIHLAAGMQFAGVRSAVATMWSVDDIAAAITTRKIYTELLGKDEAEPDPKEAAKALHKAVGMMKKANIPLTCRVPFIHIGI